MLLNIDERDLMNMMRHAFLVGYNEGRSQKDIEDCVEERDKFLTSLIEDFNIEGHCGYNEYPCSCPPEVVETPDLKRSPSSIYDSVIKRMKELHAKPIDQLNDMRANIRLVHGDMSEFTWRGCYYEIIEEGGMKFIIIIPEHHTNAWYNLEDVELVEQVEYKWEESTLTSTVLHRAPESNNETHS